MQTFRLPGASVRQTVAAAQLPTCTVRPVLRGAAAGRSVMARAADADGNGSPSMSGPISVNPSLVADAVGAGSSSKEAKQPVDRSKGLWTRCDKCGVILYIKHLKEHHHICFGCNYHLKMSSQERIDHLLDAGSWRPLDETLSPVDPLEFVDQKPYTDRITEAQTKTGMQDGVRTGTGLLHGIPVALGVMDFGYMGGSMGSVTGEKLTRLIEYATQEGMALIIVCTSGGARMQEGIFSLMQMAKISAALHVHQNKANLTYIAILTSPTTGGVTASFGMLGDIIIAEPQAIIGFAGRRVIEQTLREELPDDFQTAEYLLEHGLLDLVVPRSFLKGAIYEMLDFYKNAPYKKRGVIPFGMQRGGYLTTEEKIRRQWRTFAADSAKALAKGTDGPLSYADLVTSFQTVCSAMEGNASMDLADLAKDERLMADAVGIAKSNAIEWYMSQNELLGAKEQPTFTFRVDDEPVVTGHKV